MSGSNHQLTGPNATDWGSAGGTSLDGGKNNSTNPEPDDSGRYDCRNVYSNMDFEGPDGEIAEYRCNQWACYCCGHRMRWNLKEEIDRITAERPRLSRLLTLTLDPQVSPDDHETRHRYLTKRWNALNTAIKRQWGDYQYIWVREEQESGNPHLHILVSRYIPQEWISKRWSEIGGGRVVDIRQVDVRKVGHYLSKYLTKGSLSGFPKGIRRYGSSADLDLVVRGDRESDGEWTLMIDDYVIGKVDGSGPLRRRVSVEDFVQQRAWGGPVPPPSGNLRRKGG